MIFIAQTHAVETRAVGTFPGEKRRPVCYPRALVTIGLRVAAGQPGLMPLEILHCTLVLLGSGAGFERAQISASLGLRVDFTGVQPVLARTKFSYHVQGPQIL